MIQELIKKITVILSENYSHDFIKDLYRKVNEGSRTYTQEQFDFVLKRMLKMEILIMDESHPHVIHLLKD